MSFHFKSSPRYGTARTILSVAIAAAFIPQFAHAQATPETAKATDTKTAAKKDQAKDATTVVVTGNRASLYQALNVKKDEDHIVEVISADNLGVMPNVSVAESLVRLPGVNGLRDRGNESLVTVRGLGQRLTLGLINGREIASSEPGRGVR